MTPQLHVFVPFWGLAGGVIKVLDYAHHGVAAGFAVTLWAPVAEPDDPLVTGLPVVERLFAQGVQRRGFAELDTLRVGPSDLVLFTEPAHVQLIDPLGIPAEQTIQLIQGTRHATPTWNNGLNYRVLHRPFVRIAVTEQVRQAIGPHVHPGLPLHLIVEGHDVDYFRVARPPVADTGPVRVLYSTWKSDLGDRVRELCSDERVSFTAMRTAKGWPTLRNHYRSADIFLGAPGPEEGFYLPGLEAMAAKCAVVMALVGGNAAYAVPEANMIACDYEDAPEHLAAIRALVTDTEKRLALAESASHTARAHHIDGERDRAIEVLRNPLGNYDEAARAQAPTTRGTT